MIPRKYPSGHEKLKKKRKQEQLTQSLKGGLDKFIISKKSDIVENSNNIASEFVNKNINITYELNNDNNIINNDNTNSTDDQI